MWDESSYNWHSGECVERQIGVFIPYYQHIRDACRFSKLLIPPKCKTTFIIAGKVNDRSDRTIVCELQKKLYILTGMSREFFKGTEGFIYIVTLTSIEEPLHLPAAKFEFVAQDFPML